MKKKILTVTGVTKIFKNKFKAVDNITFDVEEGEIFGFLGVNGAGKSTTIRLILDLLKPQTGEIVIDGHNLRTDKKTALAKVGALIEGPAFYPYLSARDNLKIFAGYSNNIAPNRIDEVIKLVGLKGREHNKVNQYSMGMTQRLGIAQALLNRPRLLIMDEPTNGLDPYGIKDLRILFHNLREQEGMTIFLSSHILSEVQMICDKVAIINKGVLLVNDTVPNLLNRDNRIYIVESSRQSDLMGGLAQNSHIQIIDEEPIRIRLHEEAHPEHILQWLVSQDIPITAYYPYKPKLEDFFFNLTSKTIEVDNDALCIK